MMEGKGSVTVIGLGLMGSALARAIANAGYNLTVWNRTAQKAAPFQSTARIADSLANACAASDVIIVSVLDYAVSDSLLHTNEVAAILSGKLLIQLTTGTPSDARDGEAWAGQHGILYLDGAIMNYPRSIGTEGASLLISGPKSVFDANAEIFHAFGGNITHCGEMIAGAATLDLALVELFFGTIAMLLHGAALCAAESYPFEAFFDLAAGFLGGITSTLPETRAMILSGLFTGDNSTMVTNTQAMKHIVRASRQARIDSTLPDVLLDRFEEAIKRGHATHDLPSIYSAFVNTSVGT